MELEDEVRLSTGGDCLRLLSVFCAPLAVDIDHFCAQPFGQEEIDKCSMGTSDTAGINLTVVEYHLHGLTSSSRGSLACPVLPGAAAGGRIGWITGGSPGQATHVQAEQVGDQRLGSGGCALGIRDGLEAAVWINCHGGRCVCASRSWGPGAPHATARPYGRHGSANRGESARTLSLGDLNSQRCLLGDHATCPSVPVVG